MSRFGLRSAVQLDEKPNRRKTCNPVSTSMKRHPQQKDIKYLTNIKDENIIDDIKIEIDDSEKVSDTSDGPPRNKNINDGEDDDDDDDGIVDGDGCYIPHSSPSFKGTLICSVPLERINDVIQKLNLTKSKIENNTIQKQLMDKEVGEIDESLDNDDDEEDDNNISKQSTSTIKNLCLYCDKKFSSHKMQLKHVEKFHCLQQDRRCSGRNSQMQQSQVQRKRKTTTGSQIFHGCTFCPRGGKGQPQSVILPASDLSALFLHLTDCHADKYFGCKMCVLRFQNITKLSKHMEIVHKSVPFAFDENSSKSRDNDTDSLMSNDKSSVVDRSKLSLKRQHRSQKSSVGVNSNSGVVFGTSAATTGQSSTAITSNTLVIGAEEPILSRLGLTQNRLPNNRKGVRLRREKLIPEMLLKSEQNHQPTSNFANTITTSSTLTPSTCSPKLRGKAIKTISGFSGDVSSDVIFRVPTRNDILSCVFDDNFYKEVVSNVRNNLLFHLDGKMMGNSLESLDSAVMRHAPQPQIRSTLVKSPIVVTTTDSEIHAATSLAAITAFPTLLTAEQFGGDANSSKIRRPHTKNSWKWKWDNVKKFKLVNEGGKIVKKMKHPMLGLRDLSKLDMWTQLTMRQKHELQPQHPNFSNDDDTWTTHTTDIASDSSREEKQRLNDQLNMILDMRLLPHIILEQNEQAIIKLENDEFGIAPVQQVTEDSGDNFMAQTFADEGFLSMLNLLPNTNSQSSRTKLVLSGEWARPRCYLCMCCGAKFEKLKSLEEHKMFRHSQILSTQYEVVGRELLNGNLLRHLFLPKRALSRYSNDLGSNLIYTGAARRLFWHKNETIIREITNNDESSDSLQSMLNSCTTNSPSVKNSSSTEDCELETKIATATALGLMTNTTVVSPTHSIQSCSSTSSSGPKSNMKVQTSSQSLFNSNSSGSIYGNGCSKCGRKCNGVLDLYRHMLDCSGDYVWSLAKKRKYRYYCGSKKRRPCNKHSILELRKSRSKPPVKTPITTNESTEEGASTSANIAKPKTSPRPRPSDAESIKKMLENLPPKRVCKKIFPTLSKTKKNIKNIKPKLLAKHKIYNSLRKTRVRQMSQVAKILSKTKSQLKKSRNITTRSSDVSSSTVANKNINNKQKEIKRLLNKSAKSKTVEKPSNDKLHEEYKDELVNNIKIEDEKEIPVPFINEINLTNNDNVESTINAKKQVENTDVLVSSDDNNEQLSKVSGTKSISVEPMAPDPFPSASVIEAEASQNVQRVVSPPVNLLQEDASKVTTSSSNPILAADLERHVPNNKNIKRSKRISDCIAMLTGKLEQKLKTEQTIIVPTISVIPVANIMPQASIQLPTQLQPILPTQQLQRDKLVKATLDVPNDQHVDKIAPKKKTPKRKTTCRRIIKTDVMEETGVPAKAPELGVDIPQLMNTPVVKSAEVGSLVRDAMSTNINVSPQVLPPINAKPKSSATSDITFSQAEGQQIKMIAPPLLVSPMSSVVPLNNPNLIPKVPLYMPVETLCAPHMATMQPLPIPVSAAAPVAIENVVQPLPGSHSATGSTVMGVIPPIPIPLITTVPPAHLLAPTTIALPAGFSITAASEPLNLSSSSKNPQKQSQDLSFSNRQKMSGMPARRQTICGFEARNFVMFDEMEPLDLSKKSRPEKASPSPVISILPKSMELSPILLSAQNQLPLPNSSMGSIETSLLPVPPLTPEALLNKPFYSNLDLLRIPQVRNPVVGQAIANPETTPPPPPPPILVNNAPPISTPKTAAKKRNKSSTITSTNASVGISDSLFNSTSNPLKSHNTKEPAHVITKKDAPVKGKVVLRMDEEVINHIDDAINSVINAVKASLDCEEAEKSQGMLIASQPVIPKTTDDVNHPKESVGEFKYLAAARRNMRSKTLDCRPAALNKANVLKSAPLTENKDQTHQMAGKPIQTISVKQIDTLMVPETNSIHPKCHNISALSKTSKETMQTSEKPKILKKPSEATPVAKLSEIKSAGFPLEQNTTKGLNQTTKAATENCLATPLDKDNMKVKVANVIKPKDLAEDNECTKTSGLAAVSEVDVITANPAVNNTNLDLEQMSNNNNTSSGFHSSAQSDQQTSVMSTTTSVSTSVMAPDIKKKQRRRRKNELAAIVADQLLESFKLDKARRDNLKKLENLAYEKSEDLLLTGMLLMSSTKRNVTSSSTANNSFTSTSTAADNNQSSNKRNNKTQQNIQNAEAAKLSATTTTEVKVVDKQTIENDKSPMESIEVPEGKKNNKRRQYRRRGKTLDNENISKLKSSLESFSIDIERQLSEYEAKNVNVFKSVSSNDVGKPQANSKTQTPTNSKTTVILRPSILSVTLEASVNSDNPPAAKSSSTNDTNKTVISSRDPRLNKNIHKEGDKNTELIADEKAPAIQPQKKSGGPEEIGDLEEDNYLTEIAKNVNEKIMSTENEEFAFKDDGFEMVNDMGMDDSNSKFSRPPTSMSVRSAPNFNDDRSNFGSICDENTNTEVMDMDLDDEMSVYTSYSQDLGRGRGRRRRRRRSILLTRKPKKRASSRDLSAEKIECILCKKVFYSANSLSKHNMTLAHVSKVSEQEYLLLKTLTSPIGNIDQNQSQGTLGPYARRSTRRATISEPPMHSQSRNDDDDISPIPLPLLLPLPTPSYTDIPRRAATTTTTTPIPTAPIPSSTTQIQLPQTQTAFKPFVGQETVVAKKEDLPQTDIMETPKSANTSHLPKDLQENDYDGGNNGNGINTSFNGNSRLNLNPDERLFFECCNILKSAETPRISNVIVSEVAEECNNLNTNYNAYSFRQQDKSTTLNSVVCIRDRPNATNINTDNTAKSGIHAVGLMTSNNVHPNHQHSMEPTTLFRDPQSINTSNCYNRSAAQDNRNARSPTYSAISHLSAVTNTTSRFKTKAAMKGYENVNLDLMQQQESKSRTICKLTELAEIALGNEDKPNSHSFSPIQSSNNHPRPLAQPAPCTAKLDAIAVDGSVRIKGLPAPEYATILAVEIPKESNVQVPSRNERTKNNETRSSTSSKTIMHSSIIKAAVEEHQKTPSCNKIIIPDRPFKNIGLEEKETITFQKPKAPAVHLLTEDNSVSTGSFSDRDDYDFGSLSCDEEASIRESNDKNPKNNSSESSSESSRATAKTFENKSLIMGRIFKNVSTKKIVPSNVTAVKVKSVGVQKDQAPNPKTDLNQLFDELRGNSGVDGHCTDRTGHINPVDRGAMVVGSSRLNHKQHQREMPKQIVPASSPPAVVSSTTATPSTNARKNKSRESRAKLKAPGKTPKDISKLQSELGMSPDEIKKLIDEGQRKSKRRCATNRPKKLIEMWSSDEYEEFLSTKDIIALIEEKEQEEKRKKRKNSVNMSSNNSETAKEKDTADVTSSTKEPKRRNTRKAKVVVEPQESLIPEQGNPEAKLTKNKKSGIRRKEDPVSTTVSPAEALKTVPRKNSGKATMIDNSTPKTKRATNNKTKGQPAPKTKQVKSKKENNRSKNKKQNINNEKDDYDDDNENNDVCGEDDDDDFLISDLKYKQAKKTRANKATTSKKAASLTATVTSTANVKLSKSSVASQSTRKRSSNKKNNTDMSIMSNIAAATEVSKAQKQQPPKNKRKNQTNQSPPRRKRPATEKLYYWSSSSDEEFGRINNNKNNAPADSFEGGGEQYQKHGWIVGDSHKKLVTLLAIAKGNKKVDSNCGVKKNVSKKRN